MPDDNDQHWLDALAGKPAHPAAELATVREGAVARQAMIDSQRSQPRLDVESGARRVLGRLREEKLLQEPGLLRFGWKLPALAVAVALAIAFGLALRERPVTEPPPPEIPVMKGDPAAAQEFVTSNAVEVAAEVHASMKEAGLNPTVTERGSSTQLVAEWPRSPSQAQLEFLRLYGFARPSGSQLKIDVRPRPR